MLELHLALNHRVLSLSCHVLLVGDCTGKVNAFIVYSFAHDTIFVSDWTRVDSHGRVTLILRIELRLQSSFQRICKRYHWWDRLWSLFTNWCVIYFLFTSLCIFVIKIVRAIFLDIGGTLFCCQRQVLCGCSLLDASIDQCVDRQSDWVDPIW